jgi:small-conductance mechanosensitive channel
MTAAMATGGEWWTNVGPWLDGNRDALLIGSLVAAVLVAVMLVLRAIGSRIVAADPECRSWRSVVGRALAKTGLFFMVAAALAIVTTYAEPHPRFRRLVDILFIIAAALQAAVWARELILGAISRRAADEPGESTLANGIAVIRVLISVALFAIALIVILDNLGVNVTALIAGLGIGGIAIGLAAQGIFSDLFAALAILFDRPFRRGDTIRYGTHNLAEGHSRRSTLTFGLVYQTSPELLERVPEIARAAVQSRPGCSFLRCAMTGFGQSSLDHELLYDNATLDIDRIAADRSAIMRQLLTEFRSNGIEFAYPTQTTYTAAPDGSLVLPYRQTGPSAD